jgi:hypothetical protein
LVLSVALNHAGIDIICPPGDLPCLQLYPNRAKVRRGDRRSGLDKLSKTLESGRAKSPSQIDVPNLHQFKTTDYMLGVADDEARIAANFIAKI